MSKVETPVSGGGAGKGKPDGVSDSPAKGAAIQGRTLGGESGGGAYPNPQTGKTPEAGGFMGHGGQTNMEYHGGDQAGGGDAPNAATGSDSSDGTERGAAPAASPERKAHAVTSGERTIDVVETSGVAEAEASGKIGTDAPYEREQESPGAG